MKIAEKCKVIVAGAIVAALMAGTALPTLAASPAGNVPFAVLAQQNDVSADKVQAIKDALANIDVSYEDGVWLFESTYEDYELVNNKSYLMPYAYLYGNAVRFGMSFTSQDTEGYFYWNDVDVLIGEYNNYTSQTNYNFKKVSRRYYSDDQIFLEEVSFGGNDEDMDCLSRILNADTAYLRFNGAKVNGRQRIQTTIIDNESRQGMTDIINLYNLLQSATVEERVAAAEAVMSENKPAENDFLDAQNNAVTPEQVEALISQIGTVTRSRRAAIVAALDAYNQLDDAGKAAVTNFGVLAEAQQILGIQDALAKCSVDYDAVEDRWAITTPHYDSIDKRKTCGIGPNLYIWDKGNTIVFWEDFTYMGSSKLDIDDIILRGGDYKYTYTCGYDNSAYGYDKKLGKWFAGAFFEMEDSEVEWLRNLLSTDTVIMRFEGVDYNKFDYTWTGQDRQAITDIIDLYDLLKAVTPEVREKALRN